MLVICLLMFSGMFFSSAATGVTALSMDIDDFVVGFREGFVRSTCKVEGYF